MSESSDSEQEAGIVLDLMLPGDTNQTVCQHWMRVQDCEASHTGCQRQRTLVLCVPAHLYTCIEYVT